MTDDVQPSGAEPDPVAGLVTARAEADALRFRRLQAALLGFGVTALVGALLLASYAAIVAAHVPCVGCAPAMTGQYWAWATMAVTLAMLVWWWRAWRTLPGYERLDRGRNLGRFGVGVVVLIAVLALITNSWNVFRPALATTPPDARLALALAAALVLCLGAAGLAAGRRALLLDRADLRRPMRVGIAAAVITCSVLAGVGGWAGDDGRFVDATTATDTEMLAVPDTLGQSRFHVMVDEVVEDLHGDPAITVQRAGAGFIASTAAKATAYDPEGKHRWHYTRTGPGSVHIGPVRVFDDGRTVVMALDSDDDARPRTEPTLVALDAVTGQELWTGSGPALADAMGYRHGSYGPSAAANTTYLVAQQGDSWIRYDPRTGHEMWRIPNPMPCPEFGLALHADDRVAAFQTCVVDDRQVLRLVSVDAASGAMVLDSPVLTTPSAQELAGFSRAGRDGAALTLRVDAKQSRTIVVNVRTGRWVDLGDATVPEQSRIDPRGDVLVDDRDGSERSRLFGPDDRARCGFTDGVAPTAKVGYQHTGIAWLGSVVAYPTDDEDDQGRSLLRVADRTVCAAVGTIPIDGNVLNVTATNGVTVVQSVDDSGVAYLDGYAP